MHEIRTILCPVDFSAASERQTDLAADLSRTFEAQLVLHHNISGLSAGMAVGWMHAADHPPVTDATADDRLQALIKRLPSDTRAVAHVTHGQLSQTVIGLAAALDADLVVLSTHAETDEHESLTEQVLERGTCGVLALHEPDIERSTPRFSAASASQVLVVPTDLTAESLAAFDFACDLTRRMPFELHLIHFLAARARRERVIELVDETERRLNELLPGDLAGSARVHVEQGNAVRGIAEAARRLSAACIVMVEHTRRPLRRWLSRDTARAVLRQAPCPVWYVPGQRAA